MQRSRRVLWHEYHPTNNSNIKSGVVNVSFFVDGNSEKTYLDATELNIPDEKISFSLKFSRNSNSPVTAKINEIDIATLIDTDEVGKIDTNIFAPPVFFKKMPNDKNSGRYLLNYNSVIAKYIALALKEEVSSKISSKTIENESRRIVQLENLTDQSLCSLSNSSSTLTFEKVYNNIRTEPTNEFSKKIRTLHGIARSFAILESIDDALSNYFIGVNYIGPARAASERFYRKQELEVSEISSDGKNFPMFLASLSGPRLREFSKWVESIFGYGINLGSGDGHITINLQAGERSVNVTDTGYGVSQILPVLGMIWWAGARRPNSPPRLHRRASIQTLAIEQPELHLHPAHQAKLADVFVRATERNTATSKPNNLRLVIETHSESLINRLGELIEEGKIKNDDVSIVIFSAPDDINSPTEVSIASFNKNGALKNWPFGFFNYTEQ